MATKKKKKLGRPSKGYNVTRSLRYYSRQVKPLEKLAEENGTSVNDEIVIAIDERLERTK